MMTFLVSVTILSGVGMIAVFSRNLMRARAMSEDDFLQKFNSSKPIFVDFQYFVIAPVTEFFKQRVSPIFHEQKIKVIFMFRKVVVVLGKKLLRLDDYLHGKINLHANGGALGKSEYWNDINEFKKGLNKE